MSEDLPVHHPGLAKLLRLQAGVSSLEAWDEESRCIGHSGHSGHRWPHILCYQGQTLGPYPLGQAIYRHLCLGHPVEEKIWKVSLKDMKFSQNNATYSLLMR